jgi:hypothetical protein
VPANQPKTPVREKKTRCISFWISENEYWQVLELASDETGIATIGRKALRRFLENAKKGKQ